MIFSCNRSVQSPAVVERRKATTGFMLDCCTLRRRGFQIGATVRAETTERKFWEKVNKLGPVPAHCPEIGNCWEWTGTLSRAGYGMLITLRKPVKAHRWSFSKYVGPIVNGNNVCHHCDNKKCIRPSHLFQGTARDNVHDCIRKGRFTTGPASHTHCKYGHEFSGKNMAVKPRPGGKTERVCLICAYLRNKAVENGQTMEEFAKEHLGEASFHSPPGCGVGLGNHIRRQPPKVGSHNGFDFHIPDSGGPVGRGNNKTGTVVVKQGSAVVKRFRFEALSAESRGRALEKATRFAAYPSHGTGAAWVSAVSVRLENEKLSEPGAKT